MNFPKLIYNLSIYPGADKGFGRKARRHFMITPLSYTFVQRKMQTFDSQGGGKAPLYICP